MKVAKNSTFSLGSATHVARLAADIVYITQNMPRLNYQGVVEKINSALSQYDEENPDVTYADLEELRAVCRKLHAIFAAKNTEYCTKLINALLTEYAQTPRLSSHHGSPWHLHFDSGDDAPWAERFAASSALALAILLAEKQRNAGGLCASFTCQRPFIDTGKGGGRNYCSPRCATRERVTAHRKNKP